RRSVTKLEVSLAPRKAVTDLSGPETGRQAIGTRSTSKPAILARPETGDLMKTLIVLALVLPSFAAGTQTDTETFDGTLSQATWRLGTLDEIDSDGGDPGAYLRNRELDAAVPAPLFAGALPSPFAGDYRAAGVISLGIDLNVFGASIGVDRSRTLSLVLGSDDCEVVFVGNHSLPRVGSGWHTYDFRVPAERTRTPAGWSVGVCTNRSPDEAWNAVIAHVTHVAFPFADPGTAWYFQIWDVGIDNARITFRN